MDPFYIVFVSVVFFLPLILVTAYWGYRDYTGTWSDRKAPNKPQGLLMMFFSVVMTFLTIFGALNQFDSYHKNQQCEQAGHIVADNRCFTEEVK